ncbi:MAG: DUF6270 domain-containing protein [Micrococcales bacterium]|nr:DUF6270 domain-containing protein [Micrococcales bacterium]
MVDQQVREPTPLFIFGSCVSRDIFRVCQEERPEARKEFSVSAYLARHTLASAASRPISLAMEDINLSSAFRRRMVHNDFNKTFPAVLADNPAEYIVWDLIDERLPVLRSAKGLVRRYVTHSEYMVNAGLEESMSWKTVSDDDAARLFKRALPRFLRQLEPYLGRGRVVLHEAWWATQRRDADGTLRDLTASLASAAAARNAQLARYYEWIHERVGGQLRVVSTSDNAAPADHQWGFSLYHYGDHYYDEIYSQLLAIRADDGLS